MPTTDVSAVRASIDAAIDGRTLCDILLRNAEERGSEPALAWKEGDAWRRLSWADYRQQVAEVAMGLAALGVGRGDFVAIMARNRPEHLIADLGAVHAGATPVSLYNTLAPEQVAYIVAHCEAKVAVVEDKGFLERFEKVRDQLPSLERVVLVADGAADNDWVLSWERLRAIGRDALAADRDVFEASWKQVKPEDPATLIYTSGTTGPPKGVVITHRNALWTAASVERNLAEPVVPGTPYLSYLPLAHSFERLTGHYVCLWSAQQVHFCPEILEVMKYLPEVRPVVFVAVPRLWEKAHAGVAAALAAEPDERRRKLVARALEVGRKAVRLEQEGKPVPAGLRLQRALFDRLVFAKIRAKLGLDNCRAAVSGAAPISGEVLEFFLALGLPIAEGYGLTENTAGATLNPVGQTRVGTVGRPLPGVEIRLADDGEILIRGGNVTAGYYKEKDKTAETFDADGWLHTGDVGSIDPDGFIRVVDRKKELIVTAGGKNISPANLETLLKRHPLVGQACAIGDRRPFVSALVVLDPEVAPAWAKQHDLPSVSVEYLAKDERVVAEVKRAVDDANEHVSQVEQVKKFVILPAEWTPASEELTPTLKLKRRVILEKYAAEIESIYRPA
ncbi:MAG TPA: long-chain fatty acid--CoA ligase [Actinomycetes bacterium]|jgi:long-chain acyl-CoA synthetase|nr:long-chain fatty acid--CoA ligase [Actinomycetes bacterium]